MSDYTRFISYLYEYRNGQKSQNAGFLKVESRSSGSKLSIHIKDPALTCGLSISIYGFHRTEEHLETKLLGTTQSQSGTSNISLRLAGDSLTQFSGIVIACRNTPCYASIWDDLPFFISDIQLTPDAQPSVIVSEPEAPPLPVPVTSTDSAAPKAVSPEEAPLKAEELRTLSRWDMLFESHEATVPFEDGFLSGCIRLSLSDLPALQRDCWPLGTNAFLFHAFSSYQHLILGKLEDCAADTYLFGIPGIYHPREKFMAELHGFPYFKVSRTSKDPDSPFGYWYRLFH